MNYEIEFYKQEIVKQSIENESFSEDLILFGSLGFSRSPKPNVFQINVVVTCEICILPVITYHDRIDQGIG